MAAPDVCLSRTVNAEETSNHPATVFSRPPCARNEDDGDDDDASAPCECTSDCDGLSECDDEVRFDARWERLYVVNDAPPNSADYDGECHDAPEEGDSSCPRAYRYNPYGPNPIVYESRHPTRKVERTQEPDDEYLPKDMDPHPRCDSTATSAAEVEAAEVLAPADSAWDEWAPQSTELESPTVTATATAYNPQCPCATCTAYYHHYDADAADPSYPADFSADQQHERWYEPPRYATEPYYYQEEVYDAEPQQRYAGAPVYAYHAESAAAPEDDEELYWVEHPNVEFDEGYGSAQPPPQYDEKAAGAMAPTAPVPCGDDDGAYPYNVAGTFAEFDGWSYEQKHRTATPPPAPATAAPTAPPKPLPLRKAPPTVMCCYHKQGNCNRSAEDCWYSHDGTDATPCHYGALCKAGHRHLVKNERPRRDMWRPRHRTSALRPTSMPCNKCGAAGGVRTQEFPLFDGETMVIRMRAHCLICLQTYAL